MKIGILTFHRAHNYGAVLQCYALQTLLSKMGAEVEIIDYRQPQIEQIYNCKIHKKVVFRHCITLRISKLISYIRTCNRKKGQKEIFESFRQKYLNVSLPCDNGIHDYYDTYVIGSDQMWGIHCTNHKYDSIYWGNFKRKLGSKLYGYAISSNGDYINHLTNQEICENLANFDEVTFREKIIRDNIEEITSQHKEVSLDPTLLTDESVWEPVINNRWKDRNYVVIYQVRRLKGNETLLDRKASEFAKRFSYDIIDLSHRTFMVEDFVSIIKYAKCVFTSSFHATVFSLIFSTPFYSFKLYDGHDDRYTILLETLGLHKHLVDIHTEIYEPLYLEKDKYLPKLNNIRKKSLDYLQSIAQ